MTQNLKQCVRGVNKTLQAQLDSVIVLYTGKLSSNRNNICYQGLNFPPNCAQTGHSSSASVLRRSRFRVLISNFRDHHPFPCLSPGYEHYPHRRSVASRKSRQQTVSSRTAVGPRMWSAVLQTARSLIPRRWSRPANDPVLRRLRGPRTICAGVSEVAG